MKMNKLTEVEITCTSSTQPDFFKMCRYQYPFQENTYAFNRLTIPKDGPSFATEKEVIGTLSKLIAEPGFDINARDYSMSKYRGRGSTALIHAVDVGNEFIAKFILNKFKGVVDLNACNDSGMSVLDNCLTLPDAKESLRLSRYFLRQGVDPNVVNHRGENALMKYCRFNHADGKDKLMFLLPYIKDLNATDYNGNTALMNLCERNAIHILPSNNKTLVYFLNYRPSILAKFVSWATCLCSSNNKNKNSNNFTPVDINMKNKDGLTALLHLFKSSIINNKEAIGCMKEHGAQLFAEKIGAHVFVTIERNIHLLKDFYGESAYNEFMKLNPSK